MLVRTELRGSHNLKIIAVSYVVATGRTNERTNDSNHIPQQNKKGSGNRRDHRADDHSASSTVTHRISYRLTGRLLCIGFLAAVRIT